MYSAEPQSFILVLIINFSFVIHHFPAVSDFLLETQRVTLMTTSPQGIVELTLFQEDSRDDAEFESLTLHLSDEFGFGTPNLFFRDAQVNIQHSGG